METAEFWSIIRKSRKKAKTKDEQYSVLIDELSSRSTADIESFFGLCLKFMDNAFSWDLWGAANIVMAHCADDDFADFRCWLIEQGEQVYYRALKDPDSLAEFPAPAIGDFENPFTSKLLDVVQDVYENKTGELPTPPVDRNIPSNPAGEPFSEDDYEAMEARYPRLYKKYF
jgi:hypothetical protein